MGETYVPTTDLAEQDRSGMREAGWFRLYAKYRPSGIREAL